MDQQSTAVIIMVRPDHFGFNPQTAETNPFMHTPQALHKNEEEIRDAAVAEFESMVSTLRANDVTVHVLPSRTDVMTPDAVFPNNWFSHHQDGRLVLYPMLTPNRRLERQNKTLVELLKKNNIPVSKIIDLTADEKKGRILESTGSMVLDRVNKIAFALASSRTIEKEFEKWCKTMDYEGVYIVTSNTHKAEVYHSNLFISIGTAFAVVCLDVIENAEEQELIKKELEHLGKEVIAINLKQVYAFCGNILELQTKDGKKKIIMSKTAWHAFTGEQLLRLKKQGEIITIEIPVIEEVGGGGVRCMMAEVFPRV